MGSTLSPFCLSVGLDNKHSIEAPLVLNPETDYITTQWNVVIDDWFTTVPNSIDNLPVFNAEEWAKKFGANTYHFADIGVYDVLEGHNNWYFSSEELKAKAEALIRQGDSTTTIASP